MIQQIENMILSYNLLYTKFEFYCIFCASRRVKHGGNGKFSFKSNSQYRILQSLPIIVKFEVNSLNRVGGDFKKQLPIFMTTCI